MHVSSVVILAVVAIIVIGAALLNRSWSGDRPNSTAGPSAAARAKSIFVGVASAGLLLLMLAGAVVAFCELLVGDPRHDIARKLEARGSAAP